MEQTTSSYLSSILINTKRKIEKKIIMMEVMNDYLMDTSTYALLPYFHERYQTEIIDEDGIYYSEERPEEILRLSYLTYGASYEGRRDSVIYMTNYVQKTPILTFQEEKVISIPTHSPDHMDCAWIMYHQIRQLVPTNRNSCIIKLRNYTEIEVQASHQTMKQQMQKAGQTLDPGTGCPIYLL
ncbi:competence protein ComK [Bacillus sp. FJAT-45066]|uniref:competence protein ComK n=1 Tax=Bacillus sp. FJAT-45066 TaxID=2011010 RepID=UPI000BB970C3|nr:competence protein ComK [Bacillus sp. FJAT-45066]